MAQARYIIGVDLGTTNTALAFVDTRAADPQVRIFEIPQLVAPGATDGRPQLPSFVYLAGDHDLAPAETALPWDAQQRHVVGELARSQGARQPSRMISSSKSWLCHAGVDRHAAILPWGVQEGPRLSPVEASSLVLRHLAAAWDHAHRDQPDARFAEQDLVITVPASFDEAARELTLEAANKAGLGAVVLLEEPQAAFYAWLNRHGGRSLHDGERVLVFDVGGGTTDFSVIAVRGAGDSFERTAVGDHLLLGGDNIDLTLAKTVEARIVARTGDRRLDTLQWHGLVHACRLAKEALLSDAEVASLPITVTGRGTRLIGSTIKEELTRAELEEIIHGGFFPAVAADDLPRRSRGGLQEFGLPFAADAAITRHLAAFLRRHNVGRVDAVLFNGGTMAPASLRCRVLGQLGSWQPEAGPPRELESSHPEMAVAEGAASYGMVRRGMGTRIGGGTPRAFYVGVGAVAGTESAVCLAGRGLLEGEGLELQHDFRLLTNRPVSFKLYSSTVREDQPGAVVPARAAGQDAEDSAELVELPPIITALRAPGRGEVTVHLQVRMTELGTLEIWCTEKERADASQGWRLRFDMRAGGARVESEQREAPDDARLPEARALVKRTFEGPPEGLARLIKMLEEALQQPRDEWSTGTARGLFDALLDVEQERKRSPQHEARWLNLCGFCLRPGFGASLDNWRANQMWRIFNDGLSHPNAEDCRLAWWILFRRVAGGLNKGQQHQIYLRLAQLFLPGAKAKKKWDELKPSVQEAAEMLRCLANLERLSPEAKATLGDEILRRLETRKGREDPLTLWALGRLGARAPLYGPLNCVLPASKVSAWIETILATPFSDAQKTAFPLAHLSRRTGDRSRDVDDDLRAKIARHLRDMGAERAAALVEQIVALEAREEYIALGDTLPPGLRLVMDAGEAFA